MITNLTCPHCGKIVEVSKALDQEFKQKLELAQKEAMEKAGNKIRQEMELAIKNSEAEAKEEKERNSKLSEQLLELTKQMRSLRKESEDQKLEMEKRLALEEEKIRQDTEKKAYEVHRLKDLEKEKVINDLKKSLEEAQRKATQGSQQLQGEVLELDIESILRNSFPGDTIDPVGKGITGADIKHMVKSPRGMSCGVILWELKRTKSWSNGWLSKLKTDLRNEKANIPVIISQVMPTEIKNGMGIVEGVWVVNFDLIMPLAILLRKNLLDIAYQKAVSLHKGDKAEMLYEYITGHEFRQQVEALVEVYQEMSLQIQKREFLSKKAGRYGKCK